MQKAKRITSLSGAHSSVLQSESSEEVDAATLRLSFLFCSIWYLQKNILVVDDDATEQLLAENAEAAIILLVLPLSIFYTFNNFPCMLFFFLGKEMKNEEWVTSGFWDFVSSISVVSLNGHGAAHILSGFFIPIYTASLKK